MTRILDALRAPGAMMIALVLALVPQGEHTAQVFMRFSHEADASARWFAYAFAAAVEVAVLLFVMAGHRRISYMFAGASFLTNVVYYAIGGVALVSVQAAPVLLLSALLPACIVGYSHTIADKTRRSATPIAAATVAPTDAPASAADAVQPATVQMHAPDGAPAREDGAAHAPDDAPQPAKRARALQLADKGHTATEIARMVDAPRNTVQSWLRRAQPERNGGAMQGVQS